jgi:hypothetical protein
MQITTIGLDIAKHVFQVHGIDAAEKVIVATLTVAKEVSAIAEASIVAFATLIGMP